MELEHGRQGDALRTLRGAVHAEEQDGEVLRRVQGREEEGMGQQMSIHAECARCGGDNGFGSTGR